MGGTWRTPVKMGLLDRGFVKDMQADGTFDKVSFNREYESVWAGSSMESFYNGDVFDRARKVEEPELRMIKSGKDSKAPYYMFGIDVGRNGCQTVIVVIKVKPQNRGVGIKEIVNIITFDSEHFGIQANEIKRQYFNYLPKYVVVDGNGIGAGLIDYLVMPSQDKTTGEDLPAFGVHNDEKKQFKNLDAGKNVIKDTLWIIKANSEINAEGYTNILTQMGSGKLRFLINERDAASTISKGIAGRELTSRERAEKLRPHVLTTGLKEELMNLAKPSTDSAQFRLERINKTVEKDKVSGLMYGMYATKQIEDGDRQRKKRDLSQYQFFN